MKLYNVCIYVEVRAESDEQATDIVDAIWAGEATEEQEAAVQNAQIEDCEEIE